MRLTVEILVAVLLTALLVPLLVVAFALMGVVLGLLIGGIGPLLYVYGKRSAARKLSGFDNTLSSLAGLAAEQMRKAGMN